MDTRKRRQRQSAKKNRIVAAASRLAVNKGLDGFSLTDVARAAGISKGTLYYYYPTKSALIFDIAARHVNEITEFIVEMIGASGPDIDPAELLALFFRKHQANRTRMRLASLIITTVDGINIQSMLGMNEVSMADVAGFLIDAARR